MHLQLELIGLSFAYLIRFRVSYLLCPRNSIQAIVEEPRVQKVCTQCTLYALHIWKWWCDSEWFAYKRRLKKKMNIRWIIRSARPEKWPRYFLRSRFVKMQNNKFYFLKNADDPLPDTQSARSLEAHISNDLQKRRQRASVSLW